MSNQKEHLEVVKAEREKLLKEIEELNSQLALKKETFLKYQGIFEYLSAEVQTDEAPTEAPTEVTETEVVEE